MTREPTDTDHLAYFSGVIGVGRFRCPPGHRAWREENQTGIWPLVAFPETTVQIHQADHESVVANPNHAVCYRAGQPYRRGLIAPEGDRCTYVVIRPSALAEMTWSLGRRGEPDAPTFPAVAPPIPPRAFLAHRAAIACILRSPGPEHVAIDRSPGPEHVAIDRSPGPDQLAIDETLLAVIRSVVAAGVPRSERPAAARSRTEAAHAETVEWAKAILAERFAERLSLEAVAREVHASAFHLARMFRRRTGLALHQYRTQLRLRAAIDRLEGGDSLAGVAAACGFASHSHLTDSFRRAFGATPSELRGTGRLRAGPFSA